VSRDFEYDVFVSYSSKDRAVVQQLAERLKDEGLKVFIDQKSIKPGNDIVQTLHEALVSSRVYVICLSPNAIESHWVLAEQSTVLLDDPGNRQGRYLPVLIADCDIPAPVRRFQHIDFRNRSNEAFATLLDACGGSKKPDPRPSKPLRRRTEEKASPTWQDRLAIVQVTVDGSERISLGFWLSPTLVLTTHPELRNASSFTITPLVGSRLDLTSKAIVWPGGYPLDAFLIEAKHGDPKRWPELPPSPRIGDAQSAVAAGILLPAKGKLKRHLDSPIEIFGRVDPPTITKPFRFRPNEPTPDGLPPQILPGAPVLVAGRLLGFLAGELNEAEYRVITLASLQGIPEVSRRLGLPSTHDGCALLVSKATNLLKENPELARDLMLGAMGEGARLEIPGLVKKLCEVLDISAVQSVFAHLHQRYVKAGSAKLARQTEEVLLCVLPRVFWRELEKRGGPSSGLLQLPFVEKAFAELARAAIEGRAAEFEGSAEDPLQARRQIWASKMPASGGSDETRKRELFADLQQQLFGKTSELDRFFNPHQRNKLGSFPAEERMSHRLTLLRSLLEDKKEIEGETFYLLVERDISHHQSEVEQSVAFYAALGDLLPALEIVIMTGDPKDWSIENARLNKLGTILKSSKKTRRGA
jgi:hypothetical protein